MTETEWLTCTDPGRMLQWYNCTESWEARRKAGAGDQPSPVSDRKMRLFACAVARLVRALEPTVLNAERYADGEIELPVGEWIYWHRNAADAAAGMIQYSLERHIAERRASPEQMAVLLREIVGNPFRPVSYDRCCGLRNQGAVLRVAGVIYHERRFEDLPILADALEDSGCDNEEMLRHCRGQERCVNPQHLRGIPPDDECPDYVGTGWMLLHSPHVRGCHVVDLILGKE